MTESFSWRYVIGFIDWKLSTGNYTQGFLSREIREKVFCLMDEDYSWITGGNAEILHVSKIAYGGSGHVHEVLLPPYI